MMKRVAPRNVPSNHLRSYRRIEQSAQSMIEFALAMPLFFGLVIGTMSGSFLYFQQQALDDAVRSAARAAVVSTSLHTANSACAGGQGESGAPVTIAAAAQHGATSATSVSPAPMCITNSTTLSQSGLSSTDVVLTITGSPDLTTPTQITVRASRVVAPLSSAIGLHLTLTAQSTVSTQS